MNPSQISPPYGKLPLSFEANVGQTVDGVDFIARGEGYTLFLTPGEAVLSLQAPVESPVGGTPRQPGAAMSLRMQMKGANVNASAIGQDKLPGVANYFLGTDSSPWFTEIPTFAQVEYESVYEGIDLSSELEQPSVTEAVPILGRARLRLLHVRDLEPVMHY